MKMANLGPYNIDYSRSGRLLIADTAYIIVLIHYYVTRSCQYVPLSIGIYCWVVKRDTLFLWIGARKLNDARYKLQRQQEIFSKCYCNYCYSGTYTLRNKDTTIIRTLFRVPKVALVYKTTSEMNEDTSLFRTLWPVPIV